MALLLKLVCISMTIAIVQGYTSVKNNDRKPYEYHQIWRDHVYRPQPQYPSENHEKKTGEESLTKHADDAKNRVREFLKTFSASVIDEPLDHKPLTSFQMKQKDEKKHSAENQCGYKTCNLGKPDMVNVHIVPHTHDDVGWLKTVDQYFYGARNNIQHAAVQFILDSVFDELQADPEKRFIYVEMAFFSRWWHQLSDKTKEVVKQLVNNGQLEFTLGGWCMNDEAATHYNAIIDQHTLGFRFIEENFGECGRPRMGWQIDPFGHSREQASIFAQFGFDGQFFARLDYQDRDVREKTKNQELVWFGSESLGDQASLFTGVLYQHYMAPAGFCFECDDEPIMDDETLEDYNVDKRVKEFLAAVADQTPKYATNHIMMTMGGDFQYENARVNFKNYDKLIKHVNALQASGSKVNIFYSTPACYAYAMNQLNGTYQSKQDDFFPYASRDHTFWTGYFTSRPAIKGYERTSNNFLQVCKQLDVLSLLGPENDSDHKLGLLKKSMGIVQHHDGVSGTEKQHVADDYAKMLAKGILACQDVISDSLNKILPKSTSDISSKSLPAVQFCQMLNISACDTTEQNDQFVSIVYNPLAHAVDHWLRIPVTKDRKYTILDSSLKSIPYQLIPVSMLNLPERRSSMAAYDLVFNTQLPPLGYSTYFILVAKSGEESLKNKVTTSYGNNNLGDSVMKNEFIEATFSQATGLLKGIKNVATGVSLDITQNLMFYNGFQGDNSEGKFQSTGAYIFRPNGSDPIPINSGVVATTLFQSADVQELHQTFSDWATQVYRLYRGSKHLEVEWTVGHIPIGDNIGKEVISRFTSSLNSQKTFYTDANGRECLKRVRDYRPTWTLEQTEPVAGNYYPINSRIYIRDESKKLQLTVLTDRSQGGGSIQDGSMEILIHRRLLKDDAFGVGEALNEPGTDGKGLFARGKLYLHFDSIESATVYHRQMAQYLFMSPVVGFVPSTMDPQEYSKHFKTSWTGVTSPLPDNVHLLTLEPWGDKAYLVRLEHYFEKNENAKLSQPATVNLKGLFTSFTIKSVEEKTLGANQPLNSATRLQWNVKDHGRTGKDMSAFVKPLDPSTWKVELNAMQIRTFVVSTE